MSVPETQRPRFAGSRLRELRTTAGLRVEELAVAVGRGASMITSLELGRANPSLETLLALATVLDCEIGELIETTPAATAAA